MTTETSLRFNSAKTDYMLLRNLTGWVRHANV